MTTTAWDSDAPGVLLLPSGRLIRGRALREPLPPGPAPTLGLYLLRQEPEASPWPYHWLRWPDFGLPSDADAARHLLREVWRQAPGERVEIACRGGRGRTGTALAGIAVLDGLPPAQAVPFVRRHYNRRAVETPWQRWFVRSCDAR